MASRRAVKRTPGYEPVMGNPDPHFERPPPTDGQITHYPHTNGTVCDFKPVPTDAGAYDPVAPTCPTCAKWLAAAKAQTRARHPWIKPEEI
jgi:hypothetical protein